MKFRKSILLGITMFTLGLGFTAVNSTYQPTTTYASARRAHVVHGIRVYHWIWGDSFATSKLGKSIYLHRGQIIHVAPFYHMGKDGYMLHVNGHGSKLYYARTNNSSWFKY
ncbi:hypothetical protein FAM21731_02145 [Lentilactobacillus parabuchneri]|nr:hypothetical protein FAM21731_02145 [Lentilactobacillus parabuchneri]